MTKSGGVTSITVAILCLSWACGSARAFSVAPQYHPSIISISSSTPRQYSGRGTTSQRRAVLVEPNAADTTEEDVAVVDVYDQLGIERGNLALGVKPDEVLQYIGT